MMKKKSIGVGIGISSLMMIFTVLCFTIFAVLSLLQANIAYKQSVVYKESIESYYHADNEAMIIKMKLENDKINEEDINKYNITIQDDISYRVTIDDNKYLQVILDNNYEIISWKLVSEVDGDYGNQGFDF